MEIPDVLDAVADRLRTISGLTVTTNPGATVAVPMAVVSDGDIEYHATFGRGFDSLEVRIRVYVSKADNPAGFAEVREFKSGHGTKSIRAALETVPDTADGLNMSLTAQTGTDGLDVRLDDSNYLTVDVIASAEIGGS